LLQREKQAIRFNDHQWAAQQADHLMALNPNVAEPKPLQLWRNNCWRQPDEITVGTVAQGSRLAGRSGKG